MNPANKLKGFIPDIARILHKYDLIDILTEYILWDQFPSNHLWKKIVKEHVYEHHNVHWQDKINSYEQLTMFAEIHPDNEVTDRPTAIFATHHNTAKFLSNFAIKILL